MAIEDSHPHLTSPVKGEEIVVLPPLVEEVHPHLTSPVKGERLVDYNFSYQWRGTYSPPLPMAGEIHPRLIFPVEAEEIGVLPPLAGGS